jgi:hypothetical protein
MAKVQRYQGRGKATGKYYYRIQPYLPNGHRVTIRFGAGKKQAERGAAAIMDLIDSVKADVEPAAPTKQWIETIADEMICFKLLELQLIDSLPKKFQTLDDDGMSVGELAGFITLTESDEVIAVGIYHCKGSGGPQPGNRIDDLYEVCGQAIKSVEFVFNNARLLKKIRHRTDTG